MLRLIGGLISVAFLLLPMLAVAQAFETQARAAYVFDQTTGTVLLEKNADEALPPASMSKLMTLYMAFEAVADGRLKIDETLPVSQHAMDYGGSSMFLRAGERVSVEDLIRGVIVLSGNDATTVLAEALSPDGTEAGFATMMTDRARELGMSSTVLTNSNGWPDPDHRMSMRDLGILADHLINDFPTFYPLFAEQEFAFDGRVPANSQNRNPLLGMGIGADGLKTGHTQEAGYGLVGSAKRGDRRIVFVITGLDTPEDRRDEAERLVNWAFRQFAQRSLPAAGTRVAEAEVWMGAAPTVGLSIAEDVSLLMPLEQIDQIEAEAVFLSPIDAPVTAGQRLGELIVRREEGLPEVRVPLVADADVAAGTFGVKLRTAALVLLERFAPQQADLIEPLLTAPGGA
ncbi:D-alanyl-D-alanine carboxypeptidase [Ponticoccus sp. SC2-23]|uniref:D-alanyl-D-alanine carboxypeptidase family protein n=1 Tax=Alexandriicola marinus TaxID=2081710 RepID=UPI000FD79C20|nr:D-alanyl-D-alanine carboxypeptidase family protein [Alexandriicola marinus]MBM1220972.1 D-alanyl-D-alanine carboxypeptidase [Ponticoccus sp. SC6-9]MBM1225542.1 D-alanyl-D-alanine carboxypeptidase [Ponticoccus sp. SC6-15]MBM1227725.1 D-alanyl-D-alanine carboxypeptidase [Ponticoccus sp. SC6-38]MBM1234637.1 D-alanyl-D-alanine carboxypeptidase [Ponticoccus sp. SC6-45]MBM1238227.1 D-alanyl-D-alanine carboxypeptidase [Ponticoccus sp. SC6-49]MBM1244140.1 D-alanyl-D-alanine carboxypeptidase [Ponti